MWVIVLVAASFGAHIFIPDETFVPIWYVALAPIGYSLQTLALAPVSAGIAAGAWYAVRGGVRPRVASIAVVSVVWAILIAILATLAATDPTTRT